MRMRLTVQAEERGEAVLRSAAASFGYWIVSDMTAHAARRNAQIEEREALAAREAMMGEEAIRGGA